jgi:hypothetical protein
LPAKLDLDIGDIADEAAGAIARPDIFYREPGHALRELHGFAHRELARGHVGDETTLHAAALALSGPEHGEATFVVGARDDRADLR